ncbi:MAG: DNA-protecting protein DprA [Actinomycetaceae bacterium]|nr:DNA-protecting protein DprA [Actinomycetaceae bacterium]
MDNEHRAAITWSRITEAGDQVARALVNTLGYASAVEYVREWDPRSANLVQTNENDGRSATMIQRYQQRLFALPEFDETVLGKLGITVLIPDDNAWPAAFDDLGEDAPLAVWIRGDVSNLAQPMLAMVGSRDASPYGERLARDLAYELSSDLRIVSGGAFGIDAQAHRGALLADSTSVIVSAGGVDRPYPRAHTGLFTDTLAAGGAIVSEAPLAAAPQRHRFLSRNRLIAALGGATVVVEAPFRSGALSTARHAFAIGRPVGAIPGAVNQASSAGCNELIRNGATLVRHTQDIRELVSWQQLTMEDLAGEDFFNPASDADYDAVKERVWEALPIARFAGVASIAQTAGLTLNETQIRLGKLLVDGRAEQRDGRWRRVRGTNGNT